jgi:phenylacetate-CoA ligase
MEHLSPHHQIVVTRNGRLDDITIYAEPTEEFYAANPDETETAALTTAVQQKLRATLGLNVAVHLLAVGEAPRSEGGKLRRVDDRRDLDK